MLAFRASTLAATVLFLGRSAGGQPVKLNCSITVTRILGFDAGDRRVVVGGFAGSRAGLIQIWNVATQKMIGKPLPATHAAMSRDGKTLATLWANGKQGTMLYLWDLRGNTPLKRRRVWVPVNAIHALALSADGRTAAVAGGNGILLTPTANDAAGKQPAKGNNSGGGWIAMPKEAHLLPRVYAMEFSPDGSRLMAGCCVKVGRNKSSFARLIDVQTRSIVSLKARFAGAPEPGDRVQRWQFSANGGQIALLQPTSAATLYDTRNGNHIRTCYDDLPNFGAKPVGPRSCLLLLPGGKVGKVIVGTSGVPPNRFQIQVAQRLFLLGGGLMLNVKKWLVGFAPRQPGAMQLLDGNFRRPPRVEVRGGVEFLAPSPDGTHFAAGSSDKRSVAIRSVANPKLGVVKSVPGRDWAAFSRDGSFLATLEPTRRGNPTTVLIYKAK